MAGRIHEIELIGLAILGGVVEAHGLRLDGDAALLLDVHVIKDLLGHLAIGQPPAELNQPVRQRRLAMVDMGDDGKVADLGKVGHCPRPLAAPRRPVSSKARDQPSCGPTPCFGALDDSLNCAKLSSAACGAWLYLPAGSAVSGAPAAANA